MTRGSKKTKLAYLGKNFLVLAFLVFLIGLGLRSLILQDARGGWGMFGHFIQYKVKYEWVLMDGETLPFHTAGRLAKKASKYVGDDKRHKTVYNIYHMRSAVRAYVKYLYETVRPGNAVAMRAHLSFAVDELKFEKARLRKETHVYPEGF